VRVMKDTSMTYPKTEIPKEKARLRPPVVKLNTKLMTLRMMRMTRAAPRKPARKLKSFLVMST